jgi:hypothetical protein
MDQEQGGDMPDKQPKEARWSWPMGGVWSVSLGHALNNSGSSARTVLVQYKDMVTSGGKLAQGHLGWRGGTCNLGCWQSLRVRRTSERSWYNGTAQYKVMPCNTRYLQEGGRQSPDGQARPVPGTQGGSVE